jgi:hypothetical protein
MTNFFSIQDALNYLSSCLICKNEMGLDCLSGFPDGVLNFEFDNYGRGDFSPVITYSIVDKSLEDKFRINVRSNEIRRDIVNHHREDLVGVYNDSTGSYIGKTSFISPQTSGTLYLSLTGSCKGCKRYEYVLQVLINLATSKLLDIVLNSETVTFPSGNTGEKWELKNIYTTKQTIYTHFAPPAPGAIINKAEQNFPLLPINREDPSKTLERVKNLLIFT